MIEQMKVGPMAVFAYIVDCETEKEALVIDPAGAEGKILSRIDALGLTLKYVLNTHAHADHTCGNSIMLSKTNTQFTQYFNGFQLKTIKKTY